MKIEFLIFLDSRSDFLLLWCILKDHIQYISLLEYKRINNSIFKNLFGWFSVKNKLQIAKKSWFSNFEKSAYSIDIYILSMRKCEHTSISGFSIILGVWPSRWRKNRIFWPQVSIFGLFRHLQFWLFRRNFYDGRNFDRENYFKKNLWCSSKTHINI